MRSVALQHLNHGHGLTVIDPHTDLARDILSDLVREGYFDQPNAYRKLIYIDWGNGYCTPHNLLASVDHPANPERIDDRAHNLALNILDAAYRVWPELQSGAPLFKEFYIAGIMTLIYNKLPITYLRETLDSPEFRALCLEQVPDRLIRQTWSNLDKLQSRDQAERVASTMRRAFDLTFHPITRLNMGQPDSVIDHRQWMRDEVSVIHDLGGIKNTLTKKILGALLMIDSEQAAFSMVDLPLAQRKRRYLLLDEWPLFAAQADTIGEILEQTAKYGLTTYLACQSLGQIPSQRLQAALENCRLNVAFGLGRDSALIQARQMADVDLLKIKEAAWTAEQKNLYFSVTEQQEGFAQQLQNLDTQYAVVKLYNQQPVTIKSVTMQRERADPTALAQVLATYRQLYQRTAAEAEAKQVTLEAQLLLSSTASPQPAAKPTYARAFKQRKPKITSEPGSEA